MTKFLGTFSDMFCSHFALAIRTLGHLFALRGPSLACFWVALAVGLEAPSPLALALALHLTLRVSGNLPGLRRLDRPIPKAVWLGVVIVPLLPFLASDGALMVSWSTATAAFGWSLWWWPDLRAQDSAMRPAPIADAGLWANIRAATLVATGALGLGLSLGASPAVWIVGVYIGAAAFDLTGLLYLAADRRI